MYRIAETMALDSVLFRSYKNVTEGRTVSCTDILHIQANFLFIDYMPPDALQSKKRAYPEKSNSYMVVKQLNNKYECENLLPGLFNCCRYMFVLASVLPSYPGSSDRFSRGYFLTKGRTFPQS